MYEIRTNKESFKMKSFIAIACLFTAAYACSPTPPVIGTWTRALEPVLNYVIKSWPNFGDSYGTYKCQYVYVYALA